MSNSLIDRLGKEYRSANLAKAESGSMDTIFYLQAWEAI